MPRDRIAISESQNKIMARYGEKRDHFSVFLIEICSRRCCARKEKQKSVKYTCKIDNMMNNQTKYPYLQDRQP